MHHAVRRALARPSEHFAGEAPSGTRSVVILVVLAFTSVGLLPAVVALLRAWSEAGLDIVDVLPAVGYASGSTDVAVPGVFLVSAFTMIAFPILAWVAYAAVFHVASWPAATEGSFRRTLVFVAWGFLPQIVASVLTLVAIAATFPGSAERLWGLGVTFPARTYATSVHATPLLVASNTAGAACTVWSGYVWIYAVAAARGITRRQAAGVIAVPVLISLAVTPPVSRVLLSSL